MANIKIKLMKVIQIYFTFKTVYIFYILFLFEVAYMLYNNVLSWK